MHKSVASQLTMLMDRLQTIESFVRIAHAGSYTKAAQQLGVSRALLSRRIIELEARLGVRLLNRSTRSVSLRHEGRAYLTRCKQVLEDMEFSGPRDCSRRADAARRYSRAGAEVFRRHMPVRRDDRIFEDAQAGPHIALARRFQLSAPPTSSTRALIWPFASPTFAI